LAQRYELIKKVKKKKKEKHPTKKHGKKKKTKGLKPEKETTLLKVQSTQ